MAIDFPSSPTVGMEHTSGGMTYVYNGTGWTIKGGSTTDLATKVYVDAANATQDTAIAAKVAKAGDTMAGHLSLPIAPAAANAVRKDYVDAAITAYAAPLDALAYNGMQINGSMDVSQELGSTGRSTNGYVCDGWLFGKSNVGVQTAFQVAAVGSFLGLPNWCYISVGTAVSSLGVGEYCALSHYIEGYRIARLNWGTVGAQPITIGFWTKHTRTGTYSVAVRNGAFDRVYTTTYAQNASNTAEYKTITIPGDVTGTWAIQNTIGLNVIFAMAASAANTASSANVWSAGAFLAAPGQVNGIAATSDVFRLAGVVVLPGAQAPTAQQSPLIMRPYDQELVTCKRYWQWCPQWSGGWPTATQLIVSGGFIIPMRAAPTLAIKTAVSGTHEFGVAFRDITSIQASQFDTSGGYIALNTGSATAANRVGGINQNILTLDARL